MVRFHMHEHYNMLGAIQHLVIRDDLYDVRNIARTIGSAPDESGLDAWASQSALARVRANALAAAPDNDEGCRRTARLAEACARCHIDANVIPMFGSPPPLPADGVEVGARMARHVWAVDRLSEGMIGAVNDSWLAGLDVLARAPAPWSAMDADRAALSRRLQELADQTQKHVAKDDLSARARAYGEILVTCAACHSGDRATKK